MTYYDHFFDFADTVDVSGLFPSTYDKPLYVIGPELRNGRQYVCVRSNKKLDTPKNATVTDPAIAMPIVGTFLDLDENTKQLRVSYYSYTGKKMERDEISKAWANKVEISEDIKQ